MLQVPSRRVLYMHPQKFAIRITGRGSDLLEAAILRFADPQPHLKAVPRIAVSRPLDARRPGAEV
jgi:hypothetical protein